MMWSSDRMILTGEVGSNQRKPCPTAALYTAHTTRTGMESNPGLRVVRQATSCLNHSTDEDFVEKDISTWQVSSDKVLVKTVHSLAA
jgi:hypothetical protein